MPRKIRELKAQIAREGLYIYPSAVKAATNVGQVWQEVFDFYH